MASSTAPDTVSASKCASFPHPFSRGRGDAAHGSLGFLGLLLCCAGLFWPGMRGLWWDSMRRDLIEENAVSLALQDLCYLSGLVLCSKGTNPHPVILPLRSIAKVSLILHDCLAKDRRTAQEGMVGMAWKRSTTALPSGPAPTGSRTCCPE